MNTTFKVLDCTVKSEIIEINITGKYKVVSIMERDVHDKAVLARNCE